MTGNDPNDMMADPNDCQHKCYVNDWHDWHDWHD